MNTIYINIYNIHMFFGCIQIVSGRSVLRFFKLVRYSEQKKVPFFSLTTFTQLHFILFRKIYLHTVILHLRFSIEFEKIQIHVTLIIRTTKKLSSFQVSTNAFFFLNSVFVPE